MVQGNQLFKLDLCVLTKETLSTQELRLSISHMSVLPRFLAIELSVSPLRTVYGLTLKEATMT